MIEHKSGDRIISSIGYDQTQMIADILLLHCDQDRVDVDLTYSIGAMWKNLREPVHKFDIFPQRDDVIEASSVNVPLDDESVRSIMFDPPFTVGTTPGVIKKRFGYYKNIEDLWQYYLDTIVECHRILVDSGILIFKCQDTVSSGINYFSHQFIGNASQMNGLFYQKDLFILLAHHRMTRKYQKTQQHARKFHSYFVILQKRAPRVDYDPTRFIRNT